MRRQIRYRQFLHVGSRRLRFFAHQRLAERYQQGGIFLGHSLHCFHNFIDERVVGGNRFFCGGSGGVAGGQVRRFAEVFFFRQVRRYAEMHENRWQLEYFRYPVQPFPARLRCAGFPLLHCLRRYPEHVRSVVLDGVVPPPLALGPDVAREAQRALEQIFARCAEDMQCGAKFAGLPQLFAEVLTRLGERSRAKRNQ